MAAVPPTPFLPGCDWVLDDPTDPLVRALIDGQFPHEALIRCEPSPAGTPICWVVGNQHTGTSMLAAVWWSHAGLRSFEEVFNVPPYQYPEVLPYNYWEWVRRNSTERVDVHLPEVASRVRSFSSFLDFLRGQAPAASVILFDAKYVQARLLDGAQSPFAVPLLVRMARFNGWKVIHMRRRNTLAIHVSHLVCLARAASGQYGYSSRFAGTVHVPVDRLIPILDDLRRRAELYAAYLAGHDQYLELWYEDMLDANGHRVSDATLDGLAAFLDVDQSFNADPKTVKVSPSPRQVISNLDEVERCLAGTRYAYFLV